MRGHGTDPVDFELWSTAVSAVNGCGKCIIAHEKNLQEKGVTPEIIAVPLGLPQSFMRWQRSSTWRRFQYLRAQPKQHEVFPFGAS